MSYEDYSFEKKGIFNKLNSIKSDLLCYLSSSNFRQVKYDILNTVDLLIKDLEKYDFILEKEKF